MGEFLRARHGLDYETGFVQGPALIIGAPGDTTLTPWPNGIEDMMLVAAGATQYDLVAPWFYLGFTKTGINIVRNNAEDSYTVDQVEGAFKRRPNNWEMNVGTQLAEGSLETFAESWELDDPVAVAKVAPQLSERHVGLGAPTAYRERRIAVLFQFESGIIRAFVFRKCTRAAQESGFTYQSGGEQVSLPTRWNAQTSDETGVTKGTRFGEIFEQVPAP